MSWPPAIAALVRAHQDEVAALRKRIEDLQIQLAYARDDHETALRIMNTPYEQLEVVKEAKR